MRNLEEEEEKRETQTLEHSSYVSLSPALPLQIRFLHYRCCWNFDDDTLPEFQKAGTLLKFIKSFKFLKKKIIVSGSGEGKSN